MWNDIARRLNRPYDYGPVGGSGGSSAVAITTNVIPARVDKTPGGPITCTIQESSEGSDFAAGDAVEVYSWVRTPSPDPVDEPGGELYIFISEDTDGNWWYHAIDCTEPPPAYELIEDGDTIPDGSEVPVYYVGDAP